MEVFMKKIVLTLVIALLFTGCSGHRKASATKVGEMTPQQIAQAWEKAGAPSEGHKALQPLIGNWTAVTKMWVTPEDQPEVSTATSKSYWILGGRFLEQDFESEFHGQKFNGRGLIGFDNSADQYVGTWIDSTATGVMNSSGIYDEAKKSIIMFGEYTDPVSGLPKETKSVTTIASNDKHIFEMYERADNGEEFKSLEITYSRQ
jgi:hypothetical protein